MLGGLELPSAAQSNLVPPAFPVPEMAVTLQSFEVGGRKLRGRKELLRIGGGGGHREGGSGGWDIVGHKPLPLQAGLRQVTQMSSY